MPIHNNDIIKDFNKVSDLLEIKGANPFRVRAYRNAARTIGGLSKSVADLIAESKPLTYFSGIGKDLAEKIKEILATGQLSQLRELEKDLPPSMCSEGSKSIKADMRMN